MSPTRLIEKALYLRTTAHIDLPDEEAESF